jgi:hypothetical protein
MRCRVKRLTVEGDLLDEAAIRSMKVRRPLGGRELDVDRVRKLVGPVVRSRATS